MKNTYQKCIDCQHCVCVCGIYYCETLKNFPSFEHNVTSFRTKFNRCMWYKRKEVEK